MITLIETTTIYHPFKQAHECTNGIHGNSQWNCTCIKCRKKCGYSEHEELLKHSHIYRKIYDKYGMPIAEGMTRICFDANDQYIIKYPKSFSGIEQNKFEARMSNKTSSQGVPVASSFLETIENDIVLLWQEKVSPIILTKNKAGEYEKNLLPQWIYSLQDGYQIGYTKQGKLVCYDFGNEDE